MVLPGKALSYTCDSLPFAGLLLIVCGEDQLIAEEREVPLTPVEWRPRHLNQMADHMVNTAMATKSSKEEWQGDDGGMPGVGGVALTLFVDGGVRQGTREGAAGWYLVGTEGKVVMEVAKGQIYYGPLVLSSFMAGSWIRSVRRSQKISKSNWNRKEVHCIWESRRQVHRS